MNIRSVELTDARSICGIYNYYVTDTVITFEEETVSEEEMAGRIEKITSTHPWFVLEEDGNVIAYAYASPWRVRSAYRFSAELTVYVHRDWTGRGVGSKIYNHLIKNMEERGFHCLYGVIALPNDGSSGLHEKSGFTKCGHFHEVGFKFGRWIDVGYWEKIISV
ncbi:arsinothricin resistance N-acetyltransferase ArsN1 family B [Spirochaeta isovalerica]|uniref:Phosphinothricin acetyltransferase n=1 Tax=Spirochaeta isovalerica TaxID=150 RepID=A0A841RAC8_9SPIO|nr:arsinothricin resistance N-acetyltransferase ArsN1 family B [Spirochaeta isovalerica]MBB6480863.1 phosphinothricin acetyltransferase [Spirochaeta isovalerica]